MRLGRRKLSGIPRKNLAARRVTEIVNEYGIPTISTTTFALKNCTVQPYQADEMLLQSDGMAIKDAYIIYTDTLVQAGEESSNKKADEVMLNGSWYKVIKAAPWQVGVIEHYEVIVMRKSGELI